MLAVAFVAASFSVMVRLPWEADAVIALVAALAFAYRYEQDDPPGPHAG